MDDRLHARRSDFDMDGLRRIQQAALFGRDKWKCCRESLQISGRRHPSVYFKTGFSVADAYATGGQVVAADQVGNTGNSNGESGNWQDNLNQYGEQAKEGLKNFGDMVKEGVQGIGEAAKDLWRKYQGE